MAIDPAVYCCDKAQTLESLRKGAKESKRNARVLYIPHFSILSLAML